MDIEAPDASLAPTLTLAATATEALRALLPDGPFPPGVIAPALTALIAIMDHVTRAATEDKIDLSPTQAATRLRMARPTVMRLIARGELIARKDGGHYVLAPRDVRLFQTRLDAARREAFSTLTAMAGEFGP